MKLAQNVIKKVTVLSFFKAVISHELPIYLIKYLLFVCLHLFFTVLKQTPRFFLRKMLGGYHL